MRGEPRVVVTRSGAGSDSCELSARLAAEGVEVVPVPLTSTTPPEDESPIDRALSDLERFDWLVVTSARAVEPLRRRLEADTGAIERARMKGLRVCAVGPGTARALSEAGILVDVLPKRFRAEGVVEALLEEGPVAGRRVLFPRAEGGRAVIPRLLGEAGAAVETPAAYRTVPDPEAATRLVGLVQGRAVDALAFTAGSAASAFVRAWNAAGTGEVPSEVGIVVLGPATRDVLAAAGIRVDAMAEPHTFEALAGVATDWLREHRP